MQTKINTDERIKSVQPLPSHLLFELMDGRLLAIPKDWYPRLQSASPNQLNNWEVQGAGFSVRWPEVDEDLEISGLLAGNPAPELRSSKGEIPGALIREFRESSGISQNELAQQLGVRQATVSDWEQGKIEPSPLAAGRLRELMRKHELSKQPMSAVNSPKRETYIKGALDYWRDAAFTNMAMMPYTQGSLFLENIKIENGKAYNFTDLKLVQEAPDMNPLVQCRLFNPPRQFLHSCYGSR